MKRMGEASPEVDEAGQEAIETARQTWMTLSQTPMSNPERLTPFESRFADVAPAVAVGALNDLFAREVLMVFETNIVPGINFPTPTE